MERHADGNAEEIIGRHKLSDIEIPDEAKAPYAHNALTSIEKMLQNMFVGNPPGNCDRLLDFSKAVAGSLFFVPSASFLDALGDG